METTLKDDDFLSLIPKASTSIDATDGSNEAVISEQFVIGMFAMRSLFVTLRIFF